MQNLIVDTCIFVSTKKGPTQFMATTNKPNIARDLFSRLAGLGGAIASERTGTQFVLWGVLGGVGVVAVASVLLGAIGPVLLGAGVYAIALIVAASALRAHYPHRSIGWCNVVTLMRMALACVLIAALIAPAPPWAVWAIATLAFSLDGLDGWLARRARLSSAFGARFDMEVDAILALTIAVLVYQSGSVGAYVLLLGLPRYVFWGAQAALPWLSGDLPDRFSRKLVCVVQIGALLVLLLPFVAPPVSGLLAGIAAAALVWSFGVDVRVLWRARR